MEPGAARWLKTKNTGLTFLQPFPTDELGGTREDTEVVQHEQMKMKPFLSQVWNKRKFSRFFPRFGGQVVVVSRDEGGEH